MPRKHVDPIITAMKFFQEAPVNALDTGLAVITEIVRARKAQALVEGAPAVTAAPVAPKPKPRKRTLRKPVNTALPLAPAEPVQA